jgi:ribosomal protein S1
LRIYKGTVVGQHGRDVFVELGPRMQGVIDSDRFESPPIVGDVHEFTLRGQEDGLWALARVDQRPLVAWNEMEPGSLVHARVTGLNPGGLELKVGPLHAFMPRSHTGLAAGETLKPWVGKVIMCEVLEVDAQRQRVLLSRKRVLQRERGDDRQRQIGALKIGQIVHGVATRVEPYGVFVRFGGGLEGLVHVSNWAAERPGDLREACRVGATLEAKVLSIRQGGKKIGLGVKQLRPSPWLELAGQLQADDVIEGLVTRVLPFGAFVALAPGVEGLLAARDMRAEGDARAVLPDLKTGERLCLRVKSVDFELERMALSLFHRDGRKVAQEEAEGRRVWVESAPAQPRSVLGDALRRALEQAERRRSEKSA